MPIRYEIDRAASMIRTTCSGHVTFEEVAAHFRELSEVSQPSSPLDVLLDLSDCTSLPEPDQLRAVAGRAGDIGGSKWFRRCAIVATREILYGRLRLLEIFADDKLGAIRLFRQRLEAKEWLDSKPN